MCGYQRMTGGSWSAGPRLNSVSGLAACVSIHRTISTVQVLLLNNNVYMQYMLLLKWIIKIFAITQMEKLLFNLHFVTVTLKRICYKAFGIFFLFVSKGCKKVGECMPGIRPIINLQPGISAITWLCTYQYNCSRTWWSWEICWPSTPPGQKGWLKRSM